MKLKPCLAWPGQVRLYQGCRKKSLEWWGLWKMRCPTPPFFFFLLHYPEDGMNRLFQNFGKKLLPLYHHLLHNNPELRSSQHFTPLPICLKMFHSRYYLVTTVIQIQYLHRYVYMYTHSSQFRDTGWAEEVKSCDSIKCRVPRKSLQMPLWAHVP